MSPVLKILSYFLWHVCSDGSHVLQSAVPDAHAARALHAAEVAGAAA